MKKIYNCFLLFAVSFGSLAQSTLITPGTSQPNIIANGTHNGGITPPRMTNAQIAAIVAPVEGSLVYDTDINCLRLFDGISWKCQSENPKPIITGYSNGSTSNQVGYDIEVTGEFVYVAGEFENEIIFQDDFGPIILYSSGGKDGFLAKLRKDGKLVWAKQMANTLDCTANQVKLDPEGNVYVAGTHKGSVTISGITFNNSNNLNDIFFAKYNSSGTFQWSQLMGGSGNDTLTAMAIDNNYKIHLTGGFESTFTFYGTGGSIGATAISAGLKDLFYAKYNDLGAFLTHKAAGTSETSDLGTALEVDPSNNVFLAGYIDLAEAIDIISIDGLNFSPTNPADAVNSAGFIAKLNPSAVCVAIVGADTYLPDAVLFNDGEIYVSSHAGYSISGIEGFSFPIPTPLIKISKFSIGLLKQWSRQMYYPNQVNNVLCDAGLTELTKRYKSDMTSGLNGSVYLSGNFFCNAMFGLSNIVSSGFVEFTPYSRGKSSNGKIDGVLMEYNSSGDLINIDNFGGSLSDEFTAIKATNTGELFGTGFYQNMVNWGTNSTTSMGGKDMFLLKIIK
ncbi:MAG: hypothetical protein LCH67_09335 [Bacteroidetes bacterium]|nr:hypothetical protein [Bacteroidota bacterium]